jgi:hypothetical protein
MRLRQLAPSGCVCDGIRDRSARGGFRNGTGYTIAMSKAVKLSYQIIALEARLRAEREKTVPDSEVVGELTEQIRVVRKQWAKANDEVRR